MHINCNFDIILVRSGKAEYEGNLASNIHSNPKQFWVYVNQRAKVESCIGVLETEDMVQ